MTCPTNIGNAPFTSGQQFHGISMTPTHFYSVETSLGLTDLWEWDPTLTSHSVIYSSATFGQVSFPATDGTNLYWIEENSGIDIFSMPLTGGTPTSIYNDPTDKVTTQLVWHPTDGKLYFIKNVFASGSRSQQTLYQMATDGSGLTAIYVSALATSTDSSHLLSGFKPLAATPDALWGFWSAHGSTHQGVWRYDLASTVTFGASLDAVALVGLTDNTVAAWLADVSTSTIQNMDASFAYSAWGCDQGAGAGNLTYTSRGEWSSWTAGFAVVVFETNSLVWGQAPPAGGWRVGRVVHGGVGW